MPHSSFLTLTLYSLVSLICGDDCPHWNIFVRTYFASVESPLQKAKPREFRPVCVGTVTEVSIQSEEVNKSRELQGPETYMNQHLQPNDDPHGPLRCGGEDQMRRWSNKTQQSSILIETSSAVRNPNGKGLRIRKTAREKHALAR